MPTSALERLKQSRNVLTVTFSREETSAAEQRALGVLGQQVRIDGFRPGYAPADKIRERIGAERILEETVRQLLDSSLPAMLAEHKLQPVISPKVEATAREPLTLKITVVERPQVTVKKADSLKIDKKEPKADPKDVQKVLESVLAEHRTFAVVEREAKEGDQVVLAFSAKDQGGADIPGLSADNYAVIIGSARLLPGFEEQLVGLKKGAEKSFPLTLPDGYAAEDLRGKEVTFRVECKRVEEVKMPQLTDEFAKEKLNAQSAAEFQAMVERSILDQERQFEAMRRERALLDEIRNRTEVDLAPELLDEETASVIQEWQERLQQQGKTLDDWMKQEEKTPEQAMKEMRDQALERAKLRLGIGTLIEQRQITLTEEERDAALQEALEYFPEDKREEARTALQPGSDLYGQAIWQGLVRKLMNALLA